MREGKEKTPKADREKVKADEKGSKEDKTKAGNGEPIEPSRERDAIKESKSKEKGDRSAVAASLKSPIPRSESAESERGKEPFCSSVSLHSNKIRKSPGSTLRPHASLHHRGSSLLALSVTNGLLFLKGFLNFTHHKTFPSCLCRSQKTKA